MNQYTIYYNVKGIEDGIITVNADNKREASKNAHEELKKMYENDYRKVSIKNIYVN
jgi:hypothetical protein